LDADAGRRGDKTSGEAFCVTKRHQSRVVVFEALDWIWICCDFFAACELSHGFRSEVSSREGWLGRRRSDPSSSTSVLGVYSVVIIRLYVATVYGAVESLFVVSVREVVGHFPLGCLLCPLHDIFYSSNMLNGVAGWKRQRGERRLRVYEVVLKAEPVPEILRDPDGQSSRRHVMVLRFERKG